MSGGWAALAQFGTDLMNVGHSAIQNYKARQFAKEVMQHRYQWAVSDLKKAGINPIFAVSGGGLGGGGGSAAGMIGGAGRGGYGEAFGSAERGMSEESLRKLRAQEVKNLEATEANLKTQQAILANSAIKAAHDAKTAWWTQVKEANAATASTYMPQQAEADWRYKINAARQAAALAGQQEADLVGKKRAAELYETEYGKWIKWAKEAGGIMPPINIGPAPKRAPQRAPTRRPRQR